MFQKGEAHVSLCAHYSGRHSRVFLTFLHCPPSLYNQLHLPITTAMQCHHYTVAQPSSPVFWIIADTSNKLIVQVTSWPKTCPYALKPPKVQVQVYSLACRIPQAWIPSTSLDSFSCCQCFMPSNAMLLWLLLFHPAPCSITPSSQVKYHLRELAESMNRK